MNKRAVVAASVVATVVLMLSSCKGRTMENMEPTGETIEVNIESPGDAVESVDTLAAPAADSLTGE